MDTLNIILCWLFGVLTLFYYLVDRNLNHWSKQNVPHIKPEMIFGNSRGLSRDFHMSEFLRRMYSQLKQEGPICGIYIYFRTVAMATNLDLIKNILIRDFHIFPNRGRYFNEQDDPLSAHLINIENDEWRGLRHKLSPTFTSGKLKTMFEICHQVADNLTLAIDKEKNVDGCLEIKDVLARFVTDFIASTAFGIDCNSLANKSNKFHNMATKVFRSFSFLKRAFLMSHRELGRRLHITITNKEAEEFYTDIVSRTIQNRIENPEEQRNDFMKLLMELKDSSGPFSLTLNQIVAHSVVFLLAGYGTSSTTLAYCIYELSLNEDIRRMARKSVEDAIQKHGNLLTYDSLCDMQYLDQCLKETLRKYPPVVSLQRIAKEDYSIPDTDVIIKKGSGIMIPTFAIHWDPEIYPKPEVFDPDRFSPEEEKNRHPCAYLPFGTGPRVCIAVRFANLKLKTAMAKILMTYDFTLNKTKTPVPLKFVPGLLFLTPADGIFVNFTKK